ncbi:hypothetical protein Zmor_011300 [Zophobas morio]|uniref:Uncharacterized protein n=1 Tax=Zophobas morio TaxID=2755281 RepID=A0AA38ISX3_9CUCU|nr:hypothetical protein Zmor_011300 [Zophobas morio]
MESVKTNDEELTSTMGNLLSSSKDDKNDASDSTPTSSTDAFTTTSTSQIAADDPISSTSSDVLDAKKSTEKVNDVAQSSTNVISSNPVMSSLRDMSMRDHSSPIVSEKDLLDMNITDTSTEKITENVDDIVQDLENLLGEPTTSFQFTIRMKDSSRSSSSIMDKDLSMDLDAFSAELQMLSEQTTSPKEIFKQKPKVDEAVPQNNVVEPLKPVVSETLDTTEKADRECLESAPVLEEKESLPLASQSSELSANANDIKTDTIEKINDQIENCQFEIISASSANTEVISVEKKEFSEAEHITSTQSKTEEESCPTVEETKEMHSNDVENTENAVKTTDTSASSDEVKPPLEKIGDSESQNVSEEVTSEEKEQVEEKTVQLEEQIVKNEAINNKTEKSRFESSPHEFDLEGAAEALPSKSDVQELERLSPKENEQMEVEEVVESSSSLESIKLGDVQNSETSVQSEDQNVVEESKVESAVNIITSVTAEPLKENLTVTEQITKTPEFTKDVEEPAITCPIVKELIETRTETLDCIEGVEKPSATCTLVEEIDESKTEKPEQGVEESKSICPVVEDVDEISTKELESTKEVEEPVAACAVVTELDEAGTEELESLEGVDEPAATYAVFREVDELKTEAVASISNAEIKNDATEMVGNQETYEETVTGVDETSVGEVIQEEEKMEVDEKKMETGTPVNDTNEEENTNLEPSCTIKKEEIALPAEKIGVTTTCTANDELADSDTTMNKSKQKSKVEIENDKSAQTLEGKTETYDNVQDESIPIQVDKLVEETCNTQTEVLAIFPELVDQTQPVSSSSEKENVSDISDLETQISDKSEPPTEVTNTDEDKRTSDSAEMLISSKSEATDTLTDHQSKVEQNVVAVDETVISDSTEVQKDEVSEQMDTPDHIELQPVETSEQSKLSSVEIPTLISSNEGLNVIAADLEDVSTPVDFISDSMDISTHSLADDLDLLVQSAVNDDAPVETPAPFEDKNETTLEVPTSSDDNLKSLEGVIENNILPLAMEDVPDLDVLNAISTLSDNKSTNIIPDMDQNMQQSDALLTSSSLEETSTGDTPFEANIENSLPTVDEIFAEPNQQQPVELPDDNLETLLAVASLQNVDYSIPPVEDFTPPVEPVSDFVPEESVPPVGAVPNFVTEESATPLNVQSFVPEKSATTLDNLHNFLPKESIPSVDDVASFVEDTSRLPVSSFVPEESVFPTEDARLEPDEAEFVPAEDPPKVEPKELLTGHSKSGESKRVDQTDEQVVQEDKLKEPLVINIEDNDKERVYSPKITIKPIKPPEEEETVSSASGENESPKGSLKMTITKQSDNTHSILKIYDPDDDNAHTDVDHHQSEQSVPKLIIKPIIQPNEQPQSPKMTTRSSKQVFSPSSSTSQRSASPRITIKPIPKPEESVAPLKITIKPVLKADESHKQKHSPKLTIKPILKPEEECVEPKVHSPRVTIKPIIKPPEEVEQVSSPRITIKPIVKPTENVTDSTPITPRVTIKPVVKPTEKDKNADLEQVERSSPKITIKPILKPQETDSAPADDYEDSIKERIVLKINKGTIPSGSKELRKRDVPQEEEKSEKLTKIKLKFSKEGGHPHIVQDQSPTKRSAEQVDHDKTKRSRLETEHFLPGVTITPIGPTTHSKLKEMLSRHDNMSTDKVVTIDDDDDDVTIVEEQGKPSPIVISEESNQDSISNAAVDIRDPISEIPVFEITPESVKTINPQPAVPVAEVPAPLPAPRKRGRPRKVPLQVREDFKDPKEEEPKPVIVESTRPKRSCRGQSVRTTLGIKPRKPRGPGRGRGSKRGMGTRSTPTPPETPPKPAKCQGPRENSCLLSTNSLAHQMSKFWELEGMANNVNFTTDDEACEISFVTTTNRDPDGVKKDIKEIEEGAIEMEGTVERKLILNKKRWRICTIYSRGMKNTKQEIQEKIEESDEDFNARIGNKSREEDEENTRKSRHR